MDPVTTAQVILLATGLPFTIMSGALMYILYRRSRNFMDMAA
jgi:hypothetical protein